MAKIAINGFGRIGRNFFRKAFESSLFDIVAINDLTSTKNLAYLLQYDSVYGRYGKQVTAKEGFLNVDGKDIKVLAEKDPLKLPWRSYGIDVVVEATGFFASAEKAKAHVDAGARHVVITAPAPDVPTMLVGVNDEDFREHHGPLSASASCTSNATAPVLQILKESSGVKKAGMSTVHGYTATQKLVDAPDERDFRRGRAAAANIVPSTTGAAEAVIQSIPDLRDAFDAVSLRVPVITGSLVDLTVVSSRATTVPEVNSILKKAAMTDRWRGVLKVTEDPIVSTDVVGEPYGAIVDLSLTRVIGGDLIKVFSWYDNEAGYTATLVEHVRRIMHAS